MEGYHTVTHTEQVRTGWYTVRESMDPDYSYPPTWCGTCNTSGRKNCTNTRDHIWLGPKNEEPVKETRVITRTQLEEIVRVTVEEVIRKLQ